MSYDFPAHESTRKRRRWGCTCGCVILLIILIIIGGAASYVGLKPHREFPRYALMDGEVDGFGVLRLNSSDEGVQAFSEFVLKRLQAASKAEPDGAGKAKALSALSKFSSNIMSQFFQSESMIYATYNPVTADENIIMSAPLKNRFAWGVLRQLLQSNFNLKPTSSDGMAQLYFLGKADGGTSKVLSLDPDEMMISDSEPLLKKSLGYARDTARDAVPSEKLQYFIDELALDQPPEGEDLAFALVNEESRITNLIFAFEDLMGVNGISEHVAAALASQKLSFSDISGMKITADLVSEDQLNSHITMYCPNADVATRLTKVFTASLPALTKEDSSHAFKLQGKSEAKGATVVVALELSGMRAWIERLIPVPDSGEKVAGERKTPSATNTTPAVALPQQE